jgi:hypothetical protein
MIQSLLNHALCRFQQQVDYRDLDHPRQVLGFVLQDRAEVHR